MLCVQWNGLIFLSRELVEAQMSCDVTLTAFVAAASQSHLLICDRKLFYYQAEIPRQRKKRKEKKIKNYQ